MGARDFAEAIGFGHVLRASFHDPDLPLPMFSTLRLDEDIVPDASADGQPSPPRILDQTGSF